jgi:hypothetical protein
MARILATLAAAFVAAFACSQVPAQAEPMIGPQTAVGQPLNLLPTSRHIRHVHHSAEARVRPVAARVPHPIDARVLHRSAHRHVATATVAMPRSDEDRSTARAQDTSGLIGMLPWWRTDPMESIRYLDRESNSGVLAAADAWLAASDTESYLAIAGLGTQPDATTDEVGELEVDTGTEIADASSLKPIDLLAVAVAGPRMPDQPWLHAWLAMLAGGLAAAATARFLSS